MKSPKAAHASDNWRQVREISSPRRCATRQAIRCEKGVVRFAVTGANSASGSALTDANGEAGFCNVGTHAGLDAIRAFADTDNDGTEDANEPGAVVEHSYLPGVPAPILTPAAATGVAGTSLCVTATVGDSFGNPTPQVTLRFSVTGANTSGGPVVTDSNGEARFCYARDAFRSRHYQGACRH